MHATALTRKICSPAGTFGLLTLNIEGGLATTSYHRFVTHAWRHVLPSRVVPLNLSRIATLAAHYDVVALQEADAGSLRTRQVNQVAHLAQLAGFPHWHAAVTRELMPFARHCLGVLSRWPLALVRYHALPGWLPGRGALEVEVRPPGYRPLRLIIVHLALGRRSRARQLQFVTALVADRTDTVVLGDFNCDAAELADHGGVAAAGLDGASSQHTFPSWRPVRALDHILVTSGVDVVTASVIQERLSDHLPVAAEIRLRSHRA